MAARGPYRPRSRLAEPQLRCLSLGWGVQSFTLAALSALGDLPKLDFAIHADAGFERQHTYAFAEQWTPWLAEHGIPVRTPQPDAALPYNEHGGVVIPAYTPSKSGVGQMKRQCTYHWKLIPVRQVVRDEVRARGLPLQADVVELWIGISTDEVHRAKDSTVAFVKHRHPLLELGMSRDDCKRWLKDRDLPEPGRSSCTFCPLQSRGAWRAMAVKGGSDWNQAVQIDQALRDKAPAGVYVHPSGRPLIDIQEDAGQQPSLFDDGDGSCDSGYCFT